MVDGWIDSLQRGYRGIELVEKRLDSLVYPHDTVAVVDVKIKGIDKKLSFIQRHKDNTVQEAAHKFDINLCRVIYRIHEQKFQLPRWLDSRIFYGRGIAWLEKFYDQEHKQELMKFDDDRYLATCNRVIKYRHRGFSVFWPEDASYGTLFNYTPPKLSELCLRALQHD